jgi:hypothetical protein
LACTVGPREIFKPTNWTQAPISENTLFSSQRQAKTFARIWGKKIRSTLMAAETQEETRPECYRGGNGAVEIGCRPILVDKYFQQARSGNKRV